MDVLETRKLTMEKDMLFVASLFLSTHPSQTLYSCETLEELEIMKSFVDYINSVWEGEGKFEIVSKLETDLNRNRYTEYHIHYVENGESFNVNHKEFKYLSLGATYHLIERDWCDKYIKEIAEKHFDEIAPKYLSFKNKNNVVFNTNFFETNYDYIKLC